MCSGSFGPDLQRRAPRRLTGASSDMPCEVPSSLPVPRDKVPNVVSPYSLAAPSEEAHNSMENGHHMNTSSFTALAIIPSFRYEDAPAAIDFLCAAFGFEKHVVYEGAGGRIDHAQLKLGPHYIMLGSASDDMSWPLQTPRRLGGATGGVYIVLESDAEVDAHCARARAAGATIIREPESPDYGGRNYGARDCEGYLWSFGSYRPESATS